MNVPVFWQTSLPEIEAAYENAAHATEKRVLTLSAGGRPV